VRVDVQKCLQVLHRRAEPIDELGQRRSRWATHCQESSTTAQPGARVAVVSASLTGTRANIARE
jgi:hypothetical protein